VCSKLALALIEPLRDHFPLATNACTVHVRRVSKLLADAEAWKSVIIFCFSAGIMHTGSAVTHVYPDDHFLEKLDHLGIVTLVMGTPISTLVVRSHVCAAVTHGTSAVVTRCPSTAEALDLCHIPTT
jgi:predicted membrane channel-forming protein YqfA (hemolysin III family)